MTEKHHNLLVPGFTLIELLVVISSISLLLGVLLPALGTARKQTYSVVCRSQVRQLGIASLGYAQESDGHFVPAARDMGQGNDDLYRWHGRRPSRNAAFDPNGSPLIAYLQEGQIKECPARVDFLATSDWNSSFEKGCGGYGYNMSYLGSRLWDKRFAARFKESYQKTTSLQEVRQPTSTLMFADSAMTQDGENLIEYSFATPPHAVFGGQTYAEMLMSPSIHFRHRLYTNVGWVDGHVSQEQASHHGGANVYGANSKSTRLGWFTPLNNSLFDLE